MTCPRYRLVAAPEAACRHQAWPLTIPVLPCSCCQPGRPARPDSAENTGHCDGALSGRDGSVVRTNNGCANAPPLLTHCAGRKMPRGAAAGRYSSRTAAGCAVTSLQCSSASLPPFCISCVPIIMLLSQACCLTEAAQSYIRSCLRLTSCPNSNLLEGSKTGVEAPVGQFTPCRWGHQVFYTVDTTQA